MESTTVSTSYEGDFTLEITREEAMMDGNKGYFQYPAGGADGSKSDGQPCTQSMVEHSISALPLLQSITSIPIRLD